MTRHRTRPSGRRGGVRLTLRAGIASIDLLRSRVDLAMAQEICDAVEQVTFEEAIRVVVLHGPPGQFCLGIDGEDAGWPDWVGAVAALTVPVIAALEGGAVAEGAELALAADLRIAGRGAFLAWPHLRSGRLPGHGGTQRLPRIIGRTRALDLLLSGRRVGATEALRIGLLTAQAVRPRAAARALAAELCRKGPLALRYVKEAVLVANDLTLAQGIRLEQDLYVLLQTTADRRAGVQAFLARRRPRFRGR
jgi:enoyl-CoA hydratase